MRALTTSERVAEAAFLRSSRWRIFAKLPILRAHRIPRYRMAENLKDIYFTRAFGEALATAIAAVYPRFDAAAFVDAVFDDGWPALELKARMRHLSRCLHAALPPAYPEALAILEQVAPGFEGFDAMVFPDFVECYGLDDPDRSLPALALFTRQCSSEFAIRPFLLADPGGTLAWLNRWAADPDHHLRRLASEGCRPRLPWAQALPMFKADPSPILPILEQLRDDPSEYVRRSVANNLNDIAKDHPERVLDLCERWHGTSPERNRLVKHALRTLLKAGHPRALRLFGFEDPDHVIVTGLAVEPTSPSIGDAVTVRFVLGIRPAATTRVRLEYAIAFVRSSERTSRKVFQIRETTLAGGEHAIRFRHDFRDRSTRRHYPGDHRLAIIVNGREMAAARIDLRATPPTATGDSP